MEQLDMKLENTKGHDLTAKNDIIAIICRLYALKPYSKKVQKSFNKIGIYCIAKNML